MLQVQTVSLQALKSYENNARTHSDVQVSQIARSIERFGFTNPVLIDKSFVILAGHGRVMAAKKLGLQEVPTICLDHMSEAEKKAYILADNKLAAKAGWDNDLLKIELAELATLDLDFDLTLTGFDTPEIDLILYDEVAITGDKLPSEKISGEPAPSRVQFGDVWQLGEHKLFCGDSLKQESFDILLGEEKVDLVFTDPPYNVPVQGHVGGNGSIKHAEFALASGEMSSQEFTSFLKASFELLSAYSKPGAIHYICMDWRHIAEIMTAGALIYGELKNLCVWNKQLGGMGSLYRSQHELVFVFKSGDAPHINNIELGKHGRNRTNIWDYPGVHITNKHRDDLKFHPTVKPVQMIADAIMDCSKRGSLILDCFAGSGSTLLAAHRTGRKAYVIEYEPRYCDVILHRFETITGLKAVRIAGGTHVAQ